MIGGMVRNFILKEANVVLKMYKTLIRPPLEYCTQVCAPMLRHGNWSIIMRLEGIQKWGTKIIKRLKDYSYWERLENLGLIALLEIRMRSDLSK